MKQRLLLILCILSIRVLSRPERQAQVINSLNASAVGHVANEERGRWR